MPLAIRSIVFGLALVTAACSDAVDASSYHVGATELPTGMTTLGSVDTATLIIRDESSGARLLLSAGPERGPLAQDGGGVVHQLGGKSVTIIGAVAAGQVATITWTVEGTWFRLHSFHAQETDVALIISTTKVMSGSEYASYLAATA